MGVIQFLRAAASDDDEPDLTITEIALNRLRLAAFSALEAGATRDQVNAEVADADRLRLRMIARERTDTPT